MDMKEFIANFADQFDEIDVDTLSSETNFRNLEEWSSLVALSVMAMVDDEYEVELKADEMRKTNTIQELFDLVNSKL